MSRRKDKAERATVANALIEWKGSKPPRLRDLTPAEGIGKRKTRRRLNEFADEGYIRVEHRMLRSTRYPGGKGKDKLPKVGEVEW